MKKQILLGIFVCLMHSLIETSPGENTPLIQNKDEEKQTEIEKKPINKWKWALLGLLGVELVGGSLGAGMYEIFKPDGNGGNDGWENGFPPCNQIYRNHTKDTCSSTLPSAAWLDHCSQLGAMQKRSKKSCVPGCHWNINDGTGVFTTGSKQEKTLPQEELTRFHEWEDDKYAYAICENREGSWLHTIKEMFTNRSIPYWTTETDPSAQGTPDGISTFPTEGLVYPGEYNDIVYDQEMYDLVLNEDYNPGPCLREYGLWCVSNLYK